MTNYHNALTIQPTQETTWEHQHPVHYSQDQVTLEGVQPRPIDVSTAMLLGLANRHERDRYISPKARTSLVLLDCLNNFYPRIQTTIVLMFFAKEPLFY